TEPKEPKIRKTAKATKSRSTKAVSEENKEITEERADTTTDSNEIIKIEKQKLKKQDKNIEAGTLKVDIKITKNIKTGLITSSAYISDGTNKIWQYEKDNCKDKNREAINIIKKVINYDKNYKYIITLNVKKFIIEYNTALVYYKEKEASLQTNILCDILNDIFDRKSIGDLKIINNMRVFGDIIADYKLFSFVSK
ncbi:MAG: hypothetical protein EBU84_21155, partial [Actinobacteria bacterium]|nr:hypothetical protein [Actinomycetota bacterium]